MALVSLMGAGVLSFIAAFSNNTAAVRQKTQAAAELQATLDRIYLLATIASAYDVAGTAFCAGLVTAGGPGASATTTTGTCPGSASAAYSLTLPVDGTTLQKTITVAPKEFGATTLTEVSVSITGGASLVEQTMSTVLPLQVGSAS